jgi:hypothetical protein
MWDLYCVSNSSQCVSRRARYLPDMANSIVFRFSTKRKALCIITFPLARLQDTVTMVVLLKIVEGIKCSLAFSTR